MKTTHGSVIPKHYKKSFEIVSSVMKDHPKLLRKFLNSQYQIGVLFTEVLPIAIAKFGTKKVINAMRNVFNH